MSRRLTFVLGLTAGLAIAAVEAKPRATIELTLADLGYANGVLLEGLDPAQTMFVPIPRDVTLTGGTLRLRYRASPLLRAPSNLRVLVGGMPRVVEALAGAGAVRSASVNLSARELQARFLKVEIQGSLVHSANACLDERARTGFVHVLPESTLSLAASSAPVASVRTFWQFLPKRVRISLAPPLDAGGFVTAWALAASLTRRGRTVEFVRLPEVGEIVVASSVEVSKLGGQKLEAGNIALLSRARRPFLAVTEPYHWGQLAGMGQPWVDLAQAGQYRFQPLSDALKSEPGNEYVLRLEEAGLQDALRQAREKTEWSFYVDPMQLPPRYQVRRLVLDIVTPPASKGDVTLYTYVNGRLIQARRLDANGQSQHVVVPLDSRYLRRANQFRIVVQRNDPQGSCEQGGMLAGYPVQILPTSVLVAESDTTAPARLSDLPSYLGRAFAVYLPKGSLENPERVLGFLERLSADYGLPPPEAARVTFYGPAERLAPSGPFLVLGRPAQHTLVAPVRFDRGGVRVTDRDARTLLDVDHLPGMAVAQLTKAGAHWGLWIAPDRQQTLPVPRSVSLDDGDVTFIDETGTVFAFDSRKTELARIAYQDSRGWFELLGSYRYWLFAATWLLLTVMIIHLYRLVQKQRKAA